MATRDVPQRELRNDTARVLREVEAGDTVRITVHGRPVAQLMPLTTRRTFVPFEEIRDGLVGLLDADDPLYDELKAMDDPARDPFE